MTGPLRRLRGAVAALVLASAGSTATVLATATPAAADHCESGGLGGGVSVGCHEDGGTGPATPGGGTQIWVDPLEYLYVIDCDPNTPENPDDVLCTGATATCAGDGDIRFRVYTRDRGSNDPWRSRGVVCRGADDPDPNRPVTVDDIYDEVVQLAPIPSVKVEPATQTYVNVPTNVSTEDGTFGPYTTELDELPISITVNFTANRFRWSFGDGSTAEGAGVPNAGVGQAGAVEHRYRRAGRYQITLERTYSASVTIGGQTVEIDAPITNDSAPYPIAVGELQSVVTQVD